MKSNLSPTLFYNIYRWLIWPLLFLAFNTLALFNPKIRQGLKMRAGQPWLKWTRGQKPVWIHCASGEFEYAKPVIRLLKSRFPETKILVTYFSPSVAQAAAKFQGVDFATPLPWERASDLKAFIQHHEPRALLIARTDTWPEMLRQAKEAGIPSLLFSATLSAQSGRAKGLGRWASKAVFENLDGIFCVTSDDALVFSELGFKDRTQVAGDTRYDQVMERLRNPKPIKESLFTGQNPNDILVAGSSWPEDEAVLIELMVKDPELRLVLVPHEPTESHISSLTSLLAENKMTWIRYSQAATWPSETRVLIADQIGILAELYEKGRFAFVGGSYRKTVHSVMEPLAAGSLTFVGPLHTNNREAIEFKTIPISGEQGKRLTCVQVATDASEFAGFLTEARSMSGDQIQAASQAIRVQIQKRSGKSTAVVDWVAKYL